MKRFFSIKILLPTVTGLLTLALVAICAAYAMAALQARERANRVPVIVSISSDLFTAIQAVRVERGSLNTALAGSAPSDTEAQQSVSLIRVQTARALNSALTKLREIAIPGAAPAVDEIQKCLAALAPRRTEVDAALNRNLAERAPGITDRWVESSGDLIRAIDNLSVVLESELREQDNFIANMIRLKQIVWSLRSDSGEERLLVREAMASGKPLSEQRKREFLMLAGRIMGAWKLVQDEGRLPNTPQALKDSIAAADRIYFSTYRSKWDVLVDKVVAGEHITMTPREWTDLGSAGREAIFMLSQTAFDLARGHAASQAKTAETNLYAAVMFMIMFILIGAITVLYVLRGVVNPIVRVKQAMREVARGNVNCAIPFENRVDEIGELAGALHVFRDNSIERQRLYMEKIRAETANHTKSEFLANMSHELRTPLNAIIGFSDVIQQAMFGPLSKRYRGYGADIFSSGTHLLGLINEILDLSKLEANKLELYEEELDIAEQIEAGLRLVAPQAEKSCVKLHTTFGETMPMVRADEKRIRQILINLLSNAVKFTPAGGRVHVAYFLDGDGLAIAVRDTGIGMSKAEILKALEPFGQVDSKISRQFEGTGLGLPLAKQLVELHGGTLNIDSEVNAGTTVTVLIPKERIVAPQSVAEAALGAA